MIRERERESYTEHISWKPGYRLSSTSKSEVIPWDFGNLSFVCLFFFFTLYAQVSTDLAAMLTESKRAVEPQSNSFSESFDIKSFLGRGSFASVCKCTEKTSGKEFAAKFVRFTKGSQADLKKVATEAEIWRTVQHKNIVSLYKTFVQENEIYIVMELIQGTTLFDEIAGQTTFSETQACCIIYQVRNLLVLEY